MTGRPTSAPPVFQHVIPRQEPLWERLRQGLNERLVIVQAGSGYGKTVFLSAFAHYQRDHGAASAWLELDQTHQDRIKLLGDLARTVEEVRPGVGGFTSDALNKTKDVHRRWSYFLDLFCQELQESTGPAGTIILDRFERATAVASAREALDRVTGALPSGLTLLLSGRQPPGLRSTLGPGSPGGAFMLSATDLCFSVSEASELLSRHLQTPPSTRLLEMVMAMTGGWPAGVQMAAVFAAQEGQESLLSFSGTKPEFYGHLCETVFHREVEPRRSFLLNTSLVDRVTPDLIQVLAGESQAPDLCGSMRMGLYPGLVSRGDGGMQYEHNPVSFSFLLRKAVDACSPEQLRDLRIRLADFYSSTAQWDNALHHLLEAAEYQRASELVASLAEEAISRNSLETLARWLEAFPDEERNSRPWLLLYEGVIHRVNRNWDQALSLYNLAADVFRGDGDQNGLARTLWYASQVLSYRRNQRLATLFASEALSYLDPAEFRARAWILHSMANSYFDLGQTEESLRCHEEAIQLFDRIGDRAGLLTVTQATAWALHRLGRLKEAQEYYVRGLEIQASSGEVNMLCWLQAGLAHVRAMRGDYSDSRAALIEAVDIARKHRLLPAEAFALSNLVDIHLDLGDYAEAESCYWQAVIACQGFDDDAPQIGLHLKRIELERRRGQLQSPGSTGPALSLVEWIEASNLELTKTAHDLQNAYLSLVERRYDDAVLQAQGARTLAQKIGARYHDAQACYLLARAYLLKGDLPASSEAFEELLSLLEAEGYAGFLTRDPEATGELLVNAFRHATTSRSRIEALLLRLVKVREEIAAPLVGEDGSPVTDTVGAARRSLTALAKGLGEPVVAAPRSKRTARSRELIAEGAGAAPVRLDVLLLGPFRVHRDGHPITDRAWRTCKAKELFAYLLTCEGMTASRDQLLEVLWPELGIDSAVSNFHFTVHSLRRALEPHLKPGQPSSYLVTAGRQYKLQLPSQTQVDLIEFRRCISEGAKKGRGKSSGRKLRPLERILELYHGDFLSDIYAAWAEPLRQELLEEYLEVLRQLASSSMACREYAETIRHARNILKKDCYSEDACRLIMRAACGMGNHTMALRQYDELARLLKDDLDARPESSTQKLYQQIRDETLAHG